MRPLISVLMPTSNSSCSISRAIRSMQAQTYKDWQLCIVDDASSDLTYQIILTFILKDSRICIVQHHYQKGYFEARRTAFKMAAGDLIASLDAKDTHDPMRLEKQVDLLLGDNNLDIVTCGHNWLTKKLKLPLRSGPICASIVAWKYAYEKFVGLKPDYPIGSDGKWGHIDEYLYNQHRNTSLGMSERGNQ